VDDSAVVLPEHLGICAGCTRLYCLVPPPDGQSLAPVIRNHYQYPFRTDSADVCPGSLKPPTPWTLKENRLVVVHYRSPAPSPFAPLAGSSTACCGKPIIEIPVWHTVVSARERVTCPGQTAPA
jgi:hypothetical protein